MTGRDKNFGIVLVVKDEALDIVPWVLWHSMLGINKFYIFDDHSTDGTYEVIETLSEYYDISLKKTDLNFSNYYYFRQENSYKKAIVESGKNVEWLLFLDCDEYLRFDGFDHLEGFLDSYKDYDAICINWCNYGPNGHVLRPQQSPFEAFERRTNEDFALNAHVKSFVRPDKVGPNWINVHVFDIPQERQIMADFTNVSWIQIPGISSRPPDWRLARIMHFQCRSMEQFVERVKKRDDAKITTKDWDSFKAAQCFDPVPEMWMNRYNEALNFLKRKLVSERHGANEKNKHSECNIWYARPHFWSECDPGTEDASGQPSAIFCLVRDEESGAILFHKEGTEPLFPGDDDASAAKRVISCRVKRQHLTATVTFRCRSGYLSAAPLSFGGDLSVRPEAQTWEQFRLRPVPPNEIDVFARTLKDCWQASDIINRCAAISEAFDDREDISNAALNLIGYSDIVSFCRDRSTIPTEDSEHGSS